MQYTMDELISIYKVGQPIQIEEIATRIALLLVPLHGQPSKNGFDVEFEYIENFGSPFNHDQDFKAASSEENRRYKNRYLNVLPPDNTRVLLQVLELDDSNNSLENSQDLEQNPTSSNYINANWINGLCGRETEKSYISTQGPLPTTFYDFWRMNWENNSSVIVMLTKEFENGRLKCDRYWPSAPSESLEFGHLRLTLNKENEGGELTIRTLTLENQKTKESRLITQLQYTGWPDHGLPASTGAFLEIVDLANRENHSKGPFVVHCSAGIGRSGTFITVHSNMEKMRRMKERSETGEINVVETILLLRKQRLGMVQTKEQEMFCYLALAEAASRLGFKLEPQQEPADIWQEYFQKKKEQNTRFFPKSITDDELLNDISPDDSFLDLTNCSKLTSRILLPLEGIAELRYLNFTNCTISGSALKLFSKRNSHIELVF